MSDRALPMQVSGKCPRCGRTGKYSTPDETEWYYICECGYWEADVKKQKEAYSCYQREPRELTTHDLGAKGTMRRSEIYEGRG